MKIKLLTCVSALTLLVSGWVTAGESDSVYKLTVTSVPKGAVASQVWVGAHHGRGCSAKEKVYQTTASPAAASQFTSLGIGLNNQTFQSVAEKFKSKTYNCGVVKIINNKERVLVSKSFDLSSVDGKVFVANPANQTIG